MRKKRQKQDDLVEFKKEIDNMIQNREVARLVDCYIEVFVAKDKKLTSLLLSALQDLDELTIPFLKEVAQEDKSPFSRQASISALAIIGNTSAYEVITNAIKDENSFVRETAAKSIGELDDYEFACYLIPLLSDLDPHVREKAVRALGKLNCVDSLNRVIQLLQDESISVQIAAIETLVTLSNSHAIAPILSLLDNPHVQIVKAALKGITHLYDNLQTQPLYEAIENTAVPLDQAIIDATIISDDDILNPMLGLLKNSIPEVRIATMEAIGEMHLSEAIPELIDTLNIADHSIRLTAIRTLGEIGDKRAEVALTGLKNEPNMFIKVEVKKALDKLNNNEKSQE